MHVYLEQENAGSITGLAVSSTVVNDLTLLVNFFARSFPSMQPGTVKRKWAPITDPRQRTAAN